MKKRLDDELNSREQRRVSRIKRKRINRSIDVLNDETSKVKEDISSKVEEIEEKISEMKKETDDKNKTKKIIKEIKEADRPITTKKVKILAIITSTICILGIIAFIGCLIFAGNLLKDKPEFDEDKLKSEDSSVIYDANGDEIVELGLYLRENIDYEEMPNSLIDAFLSIEDSRYFEHFVLIFLVLPKQLLKT